MIFEFFFLYLHEFLIHDQDLIVVIVIQLWIPARFHVIYEQILLSFEHLGVERIDDSKQARRTETEHDKLKCCHGDVAETCDIVSIGGDENDGAVISCVILFLLRITVLLIHESVECHYKSAAGDGVKNLPIQTGPRCY